MEDIRYKKFHSVGSCDNSERTNEAVKFWDSLKDKFSIKNHSVVDRVDVSSALQPLYSVTCSSTVTLYNSMSNTVVKTFKSKNRNLYGGVFREDGCLFAAGSANGYVSVFELKKGLLLRDIHAHTKDVRACCFDTGKRGLFSASDDSTCKLLDISTSACLGTFKGHKDYVRSLAVSSYQPNILVSGSYDHKCLVWDTRTGSVISTLKHKFPIENMKFHHSGMLIYVANGHCLTTWDMSNLKQPIYSASLHLKTITCFDQIMGGSILITGSVDKTIKLHNSTTFDTLHTVRYPSPIATLASSSDNRLIVVGTSSGLCQVHSKLFEEDVNFSLEEKNTVESNSCEIVQTRKRNRLSKFERLLQKFNYLDAMELVFSNSGYPAETVVSFIQEMVRHNVLEKVIPQCSAGTIEAILEFLIRNVTNSTLWPTTINFLDLVGKFLESKVIEIPELRKPVKEKLSRILLVLKEMLSTQERELELLGMVDTILLVRKGCKN